MNWIEDPANKGRFSGEVYGPACYYVKMRSSAVANIFEHAMGRQRLLTFLVENKDDENILKQSFQRMGLKINIYTIHHRDMREGNLHPEALRKGREFGLQGYLIEHVEMPEMVKAYFITFCGLQNVIWAQGDDLSSNITNPQLESLCKGDVNSYRLYVVDTDKKAREGFKVIAFYQGSRGRTGHFSQSVLSNIAQRPARYVEKDTGSSNSSDDVEQKKHDLQMAAQAARDKIGKIEKQMNSKQQEQSRNADDYNRARDKKLQLNQYLRSIPDLEKRISSKEDSIKKGENALAVDEIQERQEAINHLDEAIANEMALFKKIQKKCQEVSDTFAKTAIVEAVCKGVATQLSVIRA